MYDQEKLYGIDYALVEQVPMSQITRNFVIVFREKVITPSMH